LDVPPAEDDAEVVGVPGEEHLFRRTPSLAIPFDILFEIDAGCD
jgi:hypothetical protein